MAMAASGGNELLDLFIRYNEDLWPLHVLAYGLGVAAIALVFAKRRGVADRWIAGLLAVLWLWLGVVFQGLYATDIDVLLGTVYAAMFVLEGYLLFQHGVLNRRLTFRRRNGLAGAFGWLALAYAVVVYPVIGSVLGHGWPESPLLGMAPCPTTIATFGLLLLAVPGVPKRLFVIPILWAILAPPAAMDRGVYEDAGLLIAGLVTLVLVVLISRRGSAAADQPPQQVRAVLTTRTAVRSYDRPPATGPMTSPSPAHRSTTSARATKVGTKP